VSTLLPLLYPNLVPNIKFPLSSNVGIPANTLSKQLRTTDSGCSSSWGLCGGKSLAQKQSVPYYMQPSTLASKLLLRIR